MTLPSNNNKSSQKSIVIMGATGAVGTEVVKSLTQFNQVSNLTLLGRRNIDLFPDSRKLHQHVIDISNTDTYSSLIQGHDTAICTLGVGQPSKVSKKEFTRIDKDAVIDFATEARSSGVRHFSLLSSVGVSANSSSFYLRTKGELEEALKQLHFDTLSLFHPAFLLTEKNRYGLTQAVILKCWPRINPLLVGSWRKYRGIEVSQLGTAMAMDVLQEKRSGQKTFYWDDIVLLSEQVSPSDIE